MVNTKCSAFQYNMGQEQNSLAKISATQKVIKNKFVKAYTNRVDHGNDVNETMRPLTCSRRSSTNRTKKNSLLEININELCNRLQKLINSQISRKVNYRQEIKMIISRLRELGIIV